MRQELESKLIGAKNDILKTGMRDQKLAMRNEKLQTQMDELLGSRVHDFVQGQTDGVQTRC